MLSVKCDDWSALRQGVSSPPSVEARSVFEPVEDPQRAQRYS
jgi:hypothetical protein